MPEAQPIQSNFTGGEISPRLFGRVDLAKYQHSLALCKNFRILPHGGLTRRPGTRYVATVKNSADGPCRLIPFSFSDTQEYVLELGNFYARFYTLNGQLVSGGAPNSTVSPGDPDSGIAVSPRAGSFASARGEPTSPGVGSPRFAVLSGAGVPVEVTTPYAIADVFGVAIAQKADTMYLFHKSYPIQKLQRTAAGFTFTQVDLNDGPYFPIGFATQLPSVTGITITPSGTSGTITLTASAGIFTPNHIGSQWRIQDSTVWGWVKVTGHTSNVSVTAVVQPASNNGAAGTLDGTAATIKWREGQINTIYGFPRTGLFHQSRLWIGGIPGTPASFIGSQTGDFENFSDSKSDGTVLDTSSVNYIVSSDKLNVIQWMRPSRNLIIGTAGGGEQAGGGGASNPPRTPTPHPTCWGTADARGCQSL